MYKLLCCPYDLITSLDRVTDGLERSTLQKEFCSLCYKIIKLNSLVAIMLCILVCVYRDGGSLLRCHDFKILMLYVYRRLCMNCGNKLENGQ